MSLTLASLLELPVEDLLEHAGKLGLPTRSHAWRDGLVAEIAHHKLGEAYGCGVLEIHGEGFGFLRSPYTDLLPGNDDIYVSQSQIKRFGLQTGDTVIGRIRPPKETERYAALLRVDVVNGDPADTPVPGFSEHTAVHPSTRLPLARDPWLALVDWVAPLGLGSRGLLLAPARAPRTETLRRLARTFAGDDRFEVCVLLVGERPEEVTEWRETTVAEVIATPLDELPSRQLHVAEIAFERAKRLAERGSEVLLLVDSLTRLLRFALADATPSGHLLDGVDAAALLRIRRLFAAARDLRDAGSITLVAALDDGPGDPLSAALHRDLRDVATWQLALHDRVGSVRPPIDISRSWTRRDELLLAPDEVARRRSWREGLGTDPIDDEQVLGDVFRPTAVGGETRTGH